MEMVTGASGSRGCVHWLTSGSWKLPPRDGSLRLPLPAMVFRSLAISSTTKSRYWVSSAGGTASEAVATPAITISQTIQARIAHLLCSVVRNRLSDVCP